MADVKADEHVKGIRSFNRFYTKHIGVLQEGLLNSPFSLTEVRVLYEIAHKDKPTAKELINELGLDAGYLSRILRNFEERKLIKKSTSERDERCNHLSLTTQGKKAFEQLDTRSHSEVATMLNRLPHDKQAQLIGAMRTIETLLANRSEPKVPYILRPHRPGDMGWIVHRHGLLYYQEYGWDERFEALVAGIVADFIKNFDAKHEYCWIAERDGEIVGSIFLVKQSKTVAKLRLLLVEPSARGLGIGKHLVQECIRFARQVKYKKITLWTNDVLTTARHIYQEAGFKLVEEHKHHSFGHDLIGQNWELVL